MPIPDVKLDAAAQSPFFIAAVGSAITALKFTPGASLAERFLNAAAGCAFGGYIAPPLVAWLKMSTDVYLGGAAFLLGLVGMSLTAGVLQAIKDTPLGKIVTGWVSRNGTSE